MGKKYKEFSRAPVIDMDKLPKPYTMQRISYDPRDNSSQVTVSTFSQKSRLEKSGWQVIEKTTTNNTTDTGN